MSESTPSGRLSMTIGDATLPPGEGARVIVHVCNDIGAWGKGFVLAISERYPIAEEAYRDWHTASEGFALGAVQFVPVADHLWVANVIGQHDIRRHESIPPIRYDAIEMGLRTIAEWAIKHHASVHMPRIGCGLAGGTWEQIEPIIQRTLVQAGLQVTVYDFA